MPRLTYSRKRSSDPGVKAASTMTEVCVCLESECLIAEMTIAEASHSEARAAVAAATRSDVVVSSRSPHFVRPSPPLRERDDTLMRLTVKALR